MEVFVLTHCAAEDNYPPEVFSNEDAAKRRLKELYDSYSNESPFGDADNIIERKFWDTRAEITYDDDTYDIFEIFAIEVSE